MGIVLAIYLCICGFIVCPLLVSLKVIKIFKERRINK